MARHEQEQPNQGIPPPIVGFSDPDGAREFFGIPAHRAIEISRNQSELTTSTEVALRNNPEAKALQRRLKYQTELSIWADLQDTLSPQEVESRMNEMRARYDQFGREGQILLYQSLHQSNEAGITRRFVEKAGLLEQLLTETGEYPDTIKKARHITKMVFRNVPRHLKAEEFRHMDSEIQHLLIVNFPRYLADFTEIISFADPREIVVQAEVNSLSRKFERATDEEKAKISSGLRIKNKEWPLQQFDLHMTQYAELIKAGAVKPVGKRVISREEWEDKFQEAQILDDKIDLIRVFRYILSAYEDTQLDDVKEITSLLKQPEKPKTDQEIFLEAVSKGVIEDKDGLEEDVRRNLDIAVREYERLLRSQGRSGRQARALAQTRREAIFAEIFVAPDKAAFGSEDRPKELGEALDFISQFIPKKPITQPTS